jgi:hypothetical protein
VTSILCADCGRELWMKGDPDYPAIGEHLAYNALELHIEGGYGRFFDTDFDQIEEAYTFFLCHECAHKLCDPVGFLHDVTKDGHMDSNTE